MHLFHHRRHHQDRHHQDNDRPTRFPSCSSQSSNLPRPRQCRSQPADGDGDDFDGDDFDDVGNHEHGGHTVDQHKIMFFSPARRG